LNVVNQWKDLNARIEQHTKCSQTYGQVLCTKKNKQRNEYTSLNLDLFEFWSSSKMIVVTESSLLPFYNLMYWIGGNSNRIVFSSQQQPVRVRLNDLLVHVVSLEQFKTLEENRDACHIFFDMQDEGTCKHFGVEMVEQKIAMLLDGTLYSYEKECKLLDPSLPNYCFE